MLKAICVAFASCLLISTSVLAKEIRFSENSQEFRLRTTYTKRTTAYSPASVTQGHDTDLNPYISKFEHQVDAGEGVCDNFWQKIEELWEAIDSLGLRASSLDSCTEPQDPKPGSRTSLTLHMLVGPEESSDLANRESFLTDFNGGEIYGQTLEFVKVSRMISNVITSLGFSERVPAEYVLLHRKSSVKSFSYLPSFLTFYNEVEDTIRDAPGGQLLSLLNSIYVNWDYGYLLSQANIIDVLIQNIVTTIDERVIEIPHVPAVLRDCGVSSETNCLDVEFGI